MTTEEIQKRLEERPDLLARFKAGDVAVLGELFEVGVDVQVGTVTSRSLA
jgi:hypothetical protein